MASRCVYSVVLLASVDTKVGKGHCQGWTKGGSFRDSFWTIPISGDKSIPKKTGALCGLKYLYFNLFRYLSFAEPKGVHLNFPTGDKKPLSNDLNWGIVMLKNQIQPVALVLMTYDYLDNNLVTGREVDPC